MAESQALAVRDSSSEAGIMELDSILRSGEAPKMDVVTDPAELQRQIAARILDSESVADIFSGFGDAISWQDLVGVPIEVHGFRWVESSFEDGPPVFVVVDGVRMDDGAKVVLTNGGYNVLAQLTAIAKKDAFPIMVKLTVQDKPTKSGFKPLWLVQVGDAERELAESMADPSNPLDEED